MRSSAWALLLLSCLLLTSGREPERHVIEVSNAGELMELFATPLNDVTVRLAPGRYVLAPMNTRTPFPRCDTTTQSLDVTVGLKITGRRVRLTGPGDGDAVIFTDASYRLYFDGCEDCDVEGLTITGNSTRKPISPVESGIFVRGGAVRVANCLVRCNSFVENPPRTLDGIVGADGAVLEIEFSEIIGNAAGIRLLSNARAVVRNNLVQGVRVGDRAGGVGMHVGCDASMVAERNLLRDFANGITLTGTSALELRTNIVENVHENGIVSSSGGLGRVEIDRNIIYRCGGAGIAMRAEGDQRASRNFIVETGRMVPTSSAISIEGAAANAALRKNILYNNTVADESLDRDVPREIFWRERRQWTRTYRNTPVGVDGRHRFHESAFLTRYGRWMD